MNAKRKPKSKMGRPPLPPGTQKATRLSVRVSDAELKLLLAEAKRRGMTISDLLMLPWRDGKERR